MTMTIYPVVAGSFYPDDPKKLKQMIDDFLLAAKAQEKLTTPKAIISPHAGYVYSGPIAASGYACLAQENQIEKVVILAPAHQYPVSGMAITRADQYQTPLGTVIIDQEAITKIEKLPGIHLIEEAFQLEHSMEVQLPFLQVLLKQFKIIPVLVGSASHDQVVNVLEKIWGDEKTLIVISSDLSHYYDYQTAKKRDQNTAENILALNYQKIASEDACGSVGMKALLDVCQRKKLKARLVDLRSSGDTYGSGEAYVVGYGAFHFE
jgi:MEMO1 family protein